MRERRVWQNPNWKVIDGGRQNLELTVAEPVPGPFGIKKFIDGVMQRIEKSGATPFDLPETKTIVELCGPKKLRREVVVEMDAEQELPEEESEWNILSFDKRKKI
jgi:hypothetical protein